MDFFGITISFLGSLGLFLFGLNVLSNALKEAAGPGIKRVLVKMSKTRFRGVLFGTGAAAIIQSSTAVTVMAVGFVNAGLISLVGVVGIIMGANIGTTIMSWFVASAELNLGFLSPDVLGAFAAVIGASVLLFAKKEKTKNIAKVIVGFGVLFIGLSNMPQAVRPLAQLDIVREMFATLSHNPILALLLGILVTGIIQSSTASIGILQSMAMAGMIPWGAAVFIVLGQNVGTCFTTMLTSIGANRNTRAASFVHFIYNMLGAVIFGFGAFVFFTFINPTLGTEAIMATNIAMVHTGYNILLLLALFPLGGIILKLAQRMAGKDKQADINEFDIIGLDASILDTPEYALENVGKVIATLTQKLRSNIILGCEVFANEEYNEADAEAFYGTANKLDEMNEATRRFLTGLYNEELTDDQSIIVAQLVQSLAFLKRISQHSRGFVKQAGLLNEGDYSVSEESLSLFKDALEKTLVCFDNANPAFVAESIPEANRTIINAEELVSMRDDYKLRQRERVLQEEHNFEADIIFMEAFRHFAEIAKQTKSIVEIIANGNA